MVTNTPWSEELFMVEKYKKEFAKPYSKLTYILLSNIQRFCWIFRPILSTLNKMESPASAAAAIANITPYIHKGEHEETSLLELGA